MLSCLDIVNYFLAQADEDAGDLISNPKLQKLLYYAQGFHIALFNAPLFNEAMKPGPTALLFQKPTNATKTTAQAPSLNPQI